MATVEPREQPGATAELSANVYPLRKIRQDFAVVARSVPRAAGRYLSSAEDRPSRRRATTSCWICWVPSKMSRIFESRAHFSSSDCSE